MYIKPETYLVHSDTEIKGFFGNYHWLSNFHICDIKYKDITFPSSENTYQAMKVGAKHWGAFTTISPAESKKLWKTFDSLYDAESWDRVKYGIMAEILYEKFIQNVYLFIALQETGSRYLEETNAWHDTYWGVCNGVGQNNLGKLLMKLRDYWHP